MYGKDTGSDLNIEADNVNKNNRIQIESENKMFAHILTKAKRRNVALTAMTTLVMLALLFNLLPALRVSAAYPISGPAGSAKPLAPQVAGSPSDYYNLSVLMKSGENNVTTLGDSVSINDKGKVALIARMASG